MYLFAVIIAGITGIIAILHILFGIGEINEGMRIFVGLSKVSFFASLLFLVSKTNPKDWKSHLYSLVCDGCT